MKVLVNADLDAKGDLLKGLTFLKDPVALAAYRERHGGLSLARFLLDGAVVLVKGEGDEFVELIRLSDLATLTMPRQKFFALAMFCPLDEMPLYMSPSRVDFAAFNKEVEDFARAASFCV